MKKGKKIRIWKVFTDYGYRIVSASDIQKALQKYNSFGLDHYNGEKERVLDEPTKIEYLGEVWL